MKKMILALSILMAAPFAQAGNVNISKEKVLKLLEQNVAIRGALAYGKITSGKTCKSLEFTEFKSQDGDASFTASANCMGGDEQTTIINIEGNVYSGSALILSNISFIMAD